MWISLFAVFTACAVGFAVGAVLLENDGEGTSS